MKRWKRFTNLNHRPDAASTSIGIVSDKLIASELHKPPGYKDGQETRQLVALVYQQSPWRQPAAADGRGYSSASLHLLFAMGHVH